MRGPRPRILKVGTIEETSKLWIFKDWWFSFAPGHANNVWLKRHYPGAFTFEDIPGFMGYPIDELLDMALLAERYPRLYPEEPLGHGWLKVHNGHRAK